MACHKNLWKSLRVIFRVSKTIPCSSATSKCSIAVTRRNPIERWSFFIVLIRIFNWMVGPPREIQITQPYSEYKEQNKKLKNEIKFRGLDREGETKTSVRFSAVAHPFKESRLEKPREKKLNWLWKCIKHLKKGAEGQQMPEIWPWSCEKAKTLSKLPLLAAERLPGANWKQKSGGNSA